MIWTKNNSKKIDVKNYLDLNSNELLSGDIQLIDHNEMLYLYKREVEVPKFGMYFTQYYFTESPDTILQKLSKENLIEAYRYSACFLSLQLFLRSENIVGLNKYGHYRLFDVINSHADKKAYQLLKYNTLLAKSS